MSVSEAGWGAANKHVLHKMLESESETSGPANRAKSRLTTDNYHFNMVGTEGIEGRLTYVIDVTPKRQEKYLMRRSEGNRGRIIRALLKGQEGGYPSPSCSPPSLPCGGWQSLADRRP
jgi:hypothetical protein